METEHICSLMVRQYICAIIFWKHHRQLHCNCVKKVKFSAGAFVAVCADHLLLRFNPTRSIECELNMHLPLKGELLLPGPSTMAPSQVIAVSETARRGCCKVCKEPEEEGKRFLVCSHSLCMYKYYHIRCLSPDQIASEKQDEPRWYCPSCLCRGCYCDMDDNEIVMCDRCDEAYHIYCMKPPRTSVPKGDWYCESCTKARKQEGYKEKMLELHGKRRRIMVKNNKYKGFDLLVACAEQLRREEAKAEKLQRKEEAKAEKLRQKEAAAAEKLRRKEEAAAEKLRRKEE
ncbi:unnamed protein product, partial [Urochloa humidicola]